MSKFVKVAMLKDVDICDVEYKNKDNQLEGTCHVLIIIIVYL